MTYLNCPRCGLAVRAHDDHPAEPTCPRCRGQVGLTVPMYETERPRPPVAPPDGEPRVRRAPALEPQIT